MLITLFVFGIILSFNSHINRKGYNNEMRSILVSDPSLLLLGLLTDSFLDAAEAVDAELISSLISSSFD